MEWSEKVKSESESEWVFGPLFFFNFRYIIGGVWGNNNIGIKKCTTIFLWVLNLGQVGVFPQEFSKSTSWRGFLKNWSPTCRINPLGSSFWKMIFFVPKKKLQGFFFTNFFTKDFPCFFEKKNNGVFLEKNFVKGFTCKFEAEFQGLFFFLEKL